MGKILNSGYGAIFGTYWIIYAVVSSFASVFMPSPPYIMICLNYTAARHRYGARNCYFSRLFP